MKIVLLNTHFTALNPPSTKFFPLIVIWVNPVIGPQEGEIE